jgi:hypothetical protein
MTICNHVKISTNYHGYLTSLIFFGKAPLKIHIFSHSSLDHTHLQFPNRTCPFYFPQSCLRKKPSSISTASKSPCLTLNKVPLSDQQKQSNFMKSSAQAPNPSTQLYKNVLSLFLEDKSPPLFGFLATSLVVSFSLYPPTLLYFNIESS